MRIRRKRISKRSKENFKNLCKTVIWIGWCGVMCMIDWELMIGTILEELYIMQLI